MSNQQVHFSSKSYEWSTPQDLFDYLNKIYEFELDPCATKENAKCKTYFTKKDDGLNQDWYSIASSVFMNPPYGRQISKWIEKAYTESQRGCQVVCLLPARTDTHWFQEYCMQADEIMFIRGRLRFNNAKNSAPFPSMIVIFRCPIERKYHLNMPVIQTL